MPARQPIRFGYHSVAVLGAAMLASTFFAVVLTIWYGIESRQPSVGFSLLAVIATAVWFSIFVLALPGEAIIFSVLWPVTRKRTATSNAICLVAGTTAGIILASGAGDGIPGSSPRQLLLFAGIGAVYALIYLTVAATLGRERPSAKSTQAPCPADGNQLELNFEY